MSQTEKVKVASQLIEGVRSTAIGVVEERTSVSSTKTPNDTGKMVIFSDSESDEDSDSDSSVDSDRSVSKGYVQRGPVDMHFINPVALTFDNLFGTFTSGAKGWAAGALTTIVSRLISNSSGFGGMRKINIEQRKWIILDGPAAQSWTEIIEGCMDDKRELLLPNGDRFRLPQVMTLIFEMNSIEKLSPSFISRCGLSSLNQPQSQSTENSFWKMLVDSWLTKKQVDVPTLRPYISVLRGLFGSLLSPTLNFVYEMIPRLGNISCMTITKRYLVSSFFRVFEFYLADFIPASALEIKRMIKSESKRTSANQIGQFAQAKVLSMKRKDIISDLQSNFLQSLNLVLCPLLRKEGQKRFDDYIRKILDNLEALAIKILLPQAVQAHGCSHKQ